MDFQIFIPPLVGAVIGYITNDIAVKMLFHPRKAIYIGKWRLPFTPGLIPKEKHRIASSIGKVIGEQLLNTETLTEVFTSEKILLKLGTGIKDIIENLNHKEDTVENLMLHFASEEVIGEVIEEVKLDVATLIHNKIIEMNLPELLSTHAVEKIKDVVHSFTFGFIDNIFDDLMTDSLKKNFGEMIDNVIHENSEEMIDKLIETEIEKIKEQRICDIVIKYEEKLPSVVDFIVNTYEKLIKSELSKILNGINLAKIVEEKIDSFDVMQLENMIFGIMKKELNAIVYLGAVLGFIMGWVNILIL